MVAVASRTTSININWLSKIDKEGLKIKTSTYNETMFRILVFHISYLICNVFLSPSSIILLEDTEITPKMWG